MLETPQVPEAGFDYAALEPAARTVALEAAARIRSHARQAKSSLIAIGGELARVKERLGHGQFLCWLKGEFAISERTAQRYMRLHEVLGAALETKSDTVSDFGLDHIDLTALHLIAASSTPEEVREVALERAATGERVIYADVRRHIEQLNQRRAAEAIAEVYVNVVHEPREPMLVHVRTLPEPPREPRLVRVFTDPFGALKSSGAFEHDPREVALTLPPDLRERGLRDARRLAAWLSSFCDALEEAPRDVA